jgi:hypothetical protein
MMSAQLVSIFVMFISGIAVGIVIDTVRVTLHTLGIHRIAYIVEWIVWILLGSCTFILLFFIKGGQWRAVDPMAQILGIFVYELFFQKIFRLIGRVLVNIIIKPFYFIGHVFVQVVRKIIIILIKVIKGLIYPFYRFFYIKMANIFQTRK